jgi:anthranilate synthase component I
MNGIASTEWRAVDLQPDDLLALHAANPQRYPVLLQSTAPNKQTGRFDVLMAFPGERLRAFGRGELRGRASAPSFLGTLDAWFREEEREESPLRGGLEIPFRGGWFLYLSYELIREIEPRLRPRLPASGLVAEAVRIPAGVVRCCTTGQAWIFAEAGRQELISRIADDVRSLPPRPHAASSLITCEVIEEDPRIYLGAVRAALEHIRAGDIYQANLSRQWRARLCGSASAAGVYSSLCRSNAGPFAGLAVLGDTTIVSSSPERLVEVRDRVIATRPIAGTRPTSTNAARDLELVNQLRSDPKERAEHTMLIDLERNDLGKICDPGTVEVDEFMTIESYAHVHHIVSNVHGRLRDDVTPAQVIAATFPGGTITGVPKVRCMEIIAALEGTPRGAYTGSIGYLNRNGDLDLNILIRTIEMKGADVIFRAGAGIVADSDPLRELEETRAKAKGLLAALEFAPERGSEAVLERVR